MGDNASSRDAAKTTAASTGLANDPRATTTGSTPLPGRLNEPAPEIEERSAGDKDGDDDRACRVSYGHADERHSEEPAGPPVAPAAEHQAEGEHNERDEDERERRPKAVPVHRVETDRGDRVHGSRDETCPRSPQPAARRVHAQYSQRGQDDQSGAKRPRRNSVEDQEAAVDGTDRRRIGEDTAILAGERVVNQHALLGGDFVRVQEVMPQVRALNLQGIDDVPRGRERHAEHTSEYDGHEQLTSRLPRALRRLCGLPHKSRGSGGTPDERRDGQSDRCVPQRNAHDRNGREQRGVRGEREGWNGGCSDCGRKLRWDEWEQRQPAREEGEECRSRVWTAVDEAEHHACQDHPDSAHCAEMGSKDVAHQQPSAHDAALFRTSTTTTPSLSRTMRPPSLCASSGVQLGFATT